MEIVQKVELWLKKVEDIQKKFNHIFSTILIHRAYIGKSGSSGTIFGEYY